MAITIFRGDTVVLEDRLLADGSVEVRGGRITAIKLPSSATHAIDLAGFPAAGRGR